MQREKWTFQYTGAQIASEARARATYHRMRETHWEREEQEAKEKLASHGFVVEELPVTGGVRAEAKIDPTLLKRYQECYNKRESHKLRAVEYEGWVSVMKDRDHSYDLNADDYLYFTSNR